MGVYFVQKNIIVNIQYLYENNNNNKHKNDYNDYNCNEIYILRSTGRFFNCQKLTICRVVGFKVSY